MTPRVLPKANSIATYLSSIPGLHPRVHGHPELSCERASPCLRPPALPGGPPPPACSSPAVLHPAARAPSKIQASPQLSLPTVFPGMKTKLPGRAFQARANLPGGPGPQQRLRGGASLRKARRRGKAHGAPPRRPFTLGAACLSPDCPLPGGHRPAGGQVESPFRPVRCPLFGSQLGVQACSCHTLPPQLEI